MSYNDPEDWPEDDWQSENDELVTCPECQAEIYLDLNDDRCPECGHWFLAADRDKMWREASGSKPLFIKIVAVVVLVAILLPMLLLLAR